MEIVFLYKAILSTEIWNITEPGKWTCRALLLSFSIDETILITKVKILLIFVSKKKMKTNSYSLVVIFSLNWI